MDPFYVLYITISYICKVKIIYSFDTQLNGPYFQGKNLENNLLFYELSIRLAKQYYPVTLYTDEYGEEKLGHLVDEVKLLSKDDKFYLWSEPTFEAISREEGEFIHLDGDVFLNGPLNLPEGDVYYDCREDSLYEYYYKDNIEIFDKYGIGEVFPEWSTEYTGAFNVGLLGFGDDNIKKQFVDRFYKMKEWYYNDFPSDIKIHLATMTFEEHGLSCFCNKNNYNAVPLSQHNGYLHMFSSRKHIPMFVEFVRNYLETNFKG